MDAQKTRIILIMSLFFVGFTLYGNWQQTHKKPTILAEEQPISESMVPQVVSAQQEEIRHPGMKSHQGTTQPERSIPLIDINTDILHLKINPVGGDIVFAELKDYPKAEETPEVGINLLDTRADRHYTAQSYLIADEHSSIAGPDHYNGARANYRVTSTQVVMDEGKDQLTVVLNYDSEQAVKFSKRFHFKRGEYLIDVDYIIDNQSQEDWRGSAFYQLRRVFDKDSQKKKMFMMQMYQGGAYYLPDKPFNKISFDKMKDNPLNKEVKGGWVAMLEHYFLSTWIPNPEKVHHFYSQFSAPNVFKIGAVDSVYVPANTQGISKSQIYIGPEVTDDLKAISPGLNLTVDYGILWPISQFLFWVLKAIHQFVQNWGVAIILVTVCIKLAFYKLSAASYRSMGHMRRIQPKLQALKERYGDDRQGFSQAMMSLYKQEKINPLGGCLPILLQIPVFIALYYVLLESVELRQAPFMLWITDLSARDPYYVLPLLMGATMFIQQKLSPAPPDPMQAKMMMFMPVVFTFLFMSFPAGLVLYWTVNNLLSILQQWYITKRLEQEGLKRA